MTHPIFRKEIFIETANVCRFQAMLRSAWQRRSWHVIVADPGSGKKKVEVYKKEHLCYAS